MHVLIYSRDMFGRPILEDTNMSSKQTQIYQYIMYIFIQSVFKSFYLKKNGISIKQQNLSTIQDL